MNREQLFGALIADIASQPHTLKRVPEPSSVMSSDDSVHDFDKVTQTNVTVNYAASLDFIHRCRNEFSPGAKRTAIDLCSGPGHYSNCLVQHLGYNRVTGVDLSAPMIQVANRNIKAAGLQNAISFRAGNVVHLDPDEFMKADLVTFVNSAHHMPSLDHVTRVLKFAEQACAPSGLVVLTDLCRLNNGPITNRFVDLVGDDYLNNNLPALYDDFKASLLAAWSPQELASCVPQQTNRVWFHVVSAALPFFQALIGLPEGRSQLFMRESLDWANSGLLRTERARIDWETTKGIYYAGSCNQLNKINPMKVAA